MNNDEKKLTESSSAELPAKENRQTTKSMAEQKGSGSARLSGKTTTKSMAEERTCLDDLPDEPHEDKRWRLNLPIDYRIPLYELKKNLDCRSMGAGVGWILPSETASLIKLTKELGYEKGGKTIDWLLPSETASLIELTKELGYEKGGQTIDWLLPTGNKDILSLTKELGFQKGGETLDWIMSMATRPLLELYQFIEWVLKQPSIAAVKNGTPLTLSSAMSISNQFQPQQFQESTFQHPGGTIDGGSCSKQKPGIMERFLKTPSIGPSAGNQCSVPTYDKVIQPCAPPETKRPDWNATFNQFHGNEIRGDYQVPSIVNAQPKYQFDTLSVLGEKQKRSQFSDHDSGLQRVQEANQYLDRSGDLASLSSSFKRRRMEAGHNDRRWNQFQTPYPTQIGGNQAISHIKSETAPAQGLNQNTFSGVDMGCAQRFPSRYFEGMPITNQTAPVQGLKQNTSTGVDVGCGETFPSRHIAGIPMEIHVHNNNILSGNTFQQKQVFVYGSTNPGIKEGIPAQGEFENIDELNKYDQMIAQYPPPPVNDGISAVPTFDQMIAQYPPPPVNEGISAQREFQDLDDLDEFLNDDWPKMEETRGGHATSPSINVEQKETGTVLPFGTNKPP